MNEESPLIMYFVKDGLALARDQPVKDRDFVVTVSFTNEYPTVEKCDLMYDFSNFKGKACEVLVFSNSAEKRFP